MRRLAALWLVLVLAIGAAGCGKSAGERKQEKKGVLDEGRRAVFFGAKAGRYLIPEERIVEPTDPAARATEVVKILLAGPSDPHLVRTIPAAVRLLEPVRVEGKVAYVNLSRELLDIKGDVAVDRALDALVLSLTDMASIDRVQVLVEGQSGAVLDGDVVLDRPLERPFYWEYPVVPDPDRVRYLQDLVAKGQQRWRTDPASVLLFEGRMFGFTAEQLQWAYRAGGEEKTKAWVYFGGEIYVITLTRNPAVKEKGVWAITAITNERAEASANGWPVYFADRQGVSLIPEFRIFPPGDRLATVVVKALLAGPEEPYLVRTFPPGTRLLNEVRVVDATARVNLSGEFRQLQGAAEVSLAVNSLVYSLTEVPSISQVQILVEGEEGVVVGGVELDGPIRRESVSRHYAFDPERVAWLQEQVNQGQQVWRLDPLKVLIWEGRAFGFRGDELQNARLEQEGDRAVARLSHMGKGYAIELGRNPGERGIWFIKSIAME